MQEGFIITFQLKGKLMKNDYIFYIPLLVLFLVTKPHTIPASSNTDIVPLKDRIENIRKEYKMVALGGSLIRENESDLILMTGKRKKGAEIDALPDDQFHIGSCAKAMTATIIAMLVEEGKLRFDQTVGESFPELAEEILPVYKDVTLDQLLTHRGGIVANVPPTLWIKLMSTQDSVHPAEQRMKLIRGVLSTKPAATPGTESVYSNAGYAIAGVIAEKASGVTWEELMSEKLFKPLDMQSAGFGPPGMADSVSQPWGHYEGLLGFSPVFRDNPPAIAPAGTVHCSLKDWNRFIAIHLSPEDRPELGLSKESIIKLQTPVEGSNEAYGWIIEERAWGGRVLVFVGSNTMWYAVIWMAPEKGFAVTAVTNRGNPKAFEACNKVIEELIKEEELLRSRGK